jgi:Cdc6-like AAA superfamily ATPase
MFQRWLKKSGKTLFCPGIPGAGKTVLTAIVVDHLLDKYQTELAIGIAYIYCNYQRQDKQRLDDLLGSLLRQLSELQPSMPDATTKLYERHKPKRTRPSTDELVAALQSVASSYVRTFIIVDALDECQTSDGCRTRFVKDCFDLQTRCRANLFVTSRFLFSITEIFDETPTLEIRANPKDVRKYLAGQMFRLPGFVSRDIGLQEDIIRAIVGAVDGMYES